MKAWVKRRWLMALRSGKYQQGFGKLAQLDPDFGDVHCCLGVLCEISPAIKMKPEVSDVYRFDGSHVTLPDSVQDWAGLATDDPSVTLPNGPDRLSACNDDWRFDFHQIANLIEDSIHDTGDYHRAPTACQFCHGVGACFTKSGRPASRHSMAIHDDLIWMEAHRLLDLGDLDAALAQLIELDRSTAS